jgi:flagellar hook-length control protein FliK
MLLAQAGTVASDKPSTFSDVLRPFEANGGIQLAAAAMGSAKPETPVAASAPLAAGKSGEFKQHVDALLEQAAQGLPAEAQKARGTELQLDVAAKLAESHALRPPSLGDGVAREPALSGALLTSSMGDSFLRQADKATSKSSFLPAGSGIEGIWGQQAFQTSSRVDAPSVMVDPSTLSLESMVADTVSYWVTQGVQNAELKLDGFGGQPVEVRITLKGDEAHIGFRTDQPEIRQILEGAVAHLKDLLTSEGLVLSGVSVGTSAQDGAGAQEQRHRQGTRQATITTMEPVPTESRQRTNPSVGRAVDLFV